MKKNRTITICASASFYAEVLEAEKFLKARGFKVKIPLTARKMEKSGDFRVETYKTWFKNSAAYKRKAFLMRAHFRKVLEADAVLMINNDKNGFKGYIGGNGLMELALAFNARKKIYILNDIDPKLPVKEEVLGLRPVFLRGKLGNIR